jgi:hypothetical protein
MLPMSIAHPANFQAYRTRPIQFLELWNLNGWRLKVYGISARHPTLTPTLIDTKILAKAKKTAGSTAFSAPPPANAYGLGYVIVHEGRYGCWLLLDWWTDEILLQHQLYRAAEESPHPFNRVATDLVACLWELKVIAFESDAWISTIKASESGATLDGYLDHRFTGLV